MNAGNNEVEVMKQAAYRMQEFLATKNIRVQHTVALEALAASLGSRNWRTLRDKLSEPKAAPAPTLESLKGQRWAVEAVYHDGSLYSDYAGGATPMEAAIDVLYDRLASGDQVSVIQVVDRLTGDTHGMNTLHCRDLKEHGVLFQEMVSLARRVLGPRVKAMSDVQLADWRVSNLALEFLEGLLESEVLREQLTDFTRVMPATRHDADTTIGFAASDDLFRTFQTSQALWDVSNIVRDSRAELTPREQRDLYQYEALLGTFEDKVARILLNHAIAG